VSGLAAKPSGLELAPTASRRAKYVLVASKPAVDIATRWIRQPIEQVTQEVADGWLDTDLLGPTPWLVASCKSATNQPSGTKPRDVVVEDRELLG
jgi:hypothetical protein